jgi:hypothetical protein
LFFSKLSNLPVIYISLRKKYEIGEQIVHKSGFPLTKPYSPGKTSPAALERREKSANGANGAEKPTRALRGNGHLAG